MFRLENLSLRHGEKRLLENVNLEIQAGSTGGIIGNNGVGKSTLFNALLGLHQQYFGNIFIGENNIKNISPEELAETVSISFSRHEVSRDILVRELFEFSTPEDKKNNLDYYSKIFNVEEWLNLHLYELSDGMLQRVMLCRAFLSQAPIILFDEPTIYLDLKSQSELAEILKKLIQDEGRTFVIVSHHLEWLKSVADKIFVFDQQKLELH